MTDEEFDLLNRALRKANEYDTQLVSYDKYFETLPRGGNESKLLIQYLTTHIFIEKIDSAKKYRITDRGREVIKYHNGKIQEYFNAQEKKREMSELDNKLRNEANSSIKKANEWNRIKDIILIIIAILSISVSIYFGYSNKLLEQQINENKLRIDKLEAE